MPVHYAVNADVIDIRRDRPRPTDRLAVDTNVWAWAHYFTGGVTGTGVSIPNASDYVRYLTQALPASVVCYRGLTSLAELAHVVEVNEHTAYCAGVVGQVPLKEYHHNVPAERSRVVGEIGRVWSAVVSDSQPLPLLLDDAGAVAALARLASAPVDGYDLYLLEVMTGAGVTQLLSDDGDFCGVPNITLFTANPRVIGLAGAQRRLVTR